MDLSKCGLIRQLINNVIEQSLLPSQYGMNSFFYGSASEQAVDEDWTLLADPVGPGGCLPNNGWIPPMVEMKYMVGFGQIMAYPTSLYRD